MILTLALLSLFAIAAPFVLYPIALFLRAQLAPDPVHAAPCTPRVDLIICAHNEARSIVSKLENALELDYPKELLRIWVASDGSTDGTVELARRFEDRGVVVLDLPRKGKANALAAAAEASRTGDGTETAVMAFSDANSQWERSALRALTAPFADERVGGVAGDQRYLEGAKSSDSAGERSYWSFDRQLKSWQARAGNTISATGAIYAIRRILFVPPPADATDDFMISTGVIASGQRLVFAEDALAFEPTASEATGEFRRKVRIITRGLRAVRYRRQLLNPARSGVYAFELLLHKLWRRLTWIPLLVLVLLAPTFWSAGGGLAILSLITIGWLGAGAAGLAWPLLRRLKPVGLCAYVLMVQAACAVATYNSIRSHRVSLWETERAADPSPGEQS